MSKFLQIHVPEKIRFSGHQKFGWSFLVAMLFSLTTIAQIKVSGKVSIADGSILPGATVIEVGTKNGTTTNTNGVYSITVSNANAKLQVSSIGYKSQIVAINGKSVIDVVIEEDMNELSEVVVVGYGTMQKRDITGSVSSVSAKQLKDIPLTSSAEALKGRLAGVQITSTDGAPGSEMLIRVRGGGSITQDITPLYIVDGVQVEDALATLSVQDIASIDVLKDASTTAIYGARGANGVIIITTKGGMAGKSRVSINTTMGFKKMPKYYNVMTPYDFVTYQWERSRGSSTDEASFASTYGRTYDTLSIYKDIPFINWQEEVFGRAAKFQNHNVSVSGGSKTTTFNLSLTQNNEEGIQINSGLNRYLINLKLEHEVSKRLRVGFNARYIDQTIDGKGTIDAGTREASRLRHSINYRPFQLENSIYGLDESDPDYDQQTRLKNPILITSSEYRKSFTKGTYFTAFANYKISKNLEWRSTFGVDNSNVKTDQFWDKTSALAARYANLPVASIFQSQNNTLNNSNTLQFTLKNYKKKHDFTALLGQEIVQTKFYRNTTETRFFPSDITPDKALANMGLGSIPTGSTSQQPMPISYVAAPQRLFSLFGRVTYGFLDKYLMSFNIRSDRSSKFSPENSLLISPSGSVAWRLSEEDFIKRISWISDAKLRYGFGQVGNNRITNNLFLQLYGVTSSYALNHAVLPGFVPTALANPDLAWEKNLTSNFGLDLALFKGNIQLSMDIYKNTAKNLLLNVKIPSTTGYTDQIQNVGSLSNSGVELQLNAYIINKTDFSWNSTFNMAFNKNKILSLGGPDDIKKTSGWQVGGEEDYLVKVGLPVGQMYGYQTDGWYQINDFNYANGVYTLKTEVASNAVVLGYAPQPGTLKFKDLNGDGLIDTNDKSVLGDANPKFTGGWNNQFTYKGFDLGVFVNFVYGNEIYNANKIEFTQGDFPNINILEIMNNRWKTIDEKGVKVTEPALLAKLNENATIWQPNRAQRWPLHTWAVEDGSFLRLNNLTLGYTFSKKTIKKLGVSTVRLFATVNNLATITNYSGFDPDVNTRRSDPLTTGVDFAGYPNSRTWLGGLNINF